MKPKLVSQTRHISRTAICIAVLVMATTGAVQAQGFPTKAVRIVCAFPPGNSSDIVARIIGDQLGKRWGHPVIVDNKPGASGIIAATNVQKSPPDGYTLLMTSTSFVVNNAVMKDVPYDVRKDFTGINLINSIPVVLLVGKNFPANNMTEWLAEVKRNPRKYTYAHPGVGTIHNMSMKQLLQKTSSDIVEIPYKGSVQAITDIIGGQVEMMFEAANSAFTFVDAGKVKALATTGPTRYFALPNVPTMKESGVDINSVGFTALLAPAHIPKPVADFINKEVQTVLQAPEVQETMKKAALELHPPMNVQATQNWLVGESDRWAQVAASAGIQKE